MIAVVLLTPIIGLGLILLLAYVERWALDNDERSPAGPPAAGMSPAPPRSAAAVRNVT
jgi:hypothetical protein